MYNRSKRNGTVEKCIQGGIIAANGFQSSFKVYPVQMVSRVPKLRRENGHSRQQQQETPRSMAVSTSLEEHTGKEYSSDSYTVTYNRKSQLQACYYRKSREYTF